MLRLNTLFFAARRRLLLTALLSACTLAAAQSYPSKPIKFIVPFPPGSATDAVGRVLGQAMSEVLGQPITIENKAGANGILGAEAVKTSPADGYTFLVTTSTTQAANVSLYKKLSYDPIKDFTPIGKVGETGFILMVKNDFPANTMQEFIAYAKAHPGKLAYGHGSSGSLVSAAMLAQLAGLDVVSVPFKGIPPALTDLLGGQIQFAFADVGNAVSQISGGRLKGLGTTTARRAGRAPQIAVIGETVKGYDVGAWFGLVAPAKLPPDVLKKVGSAFATAMTKAEVKDKLHQAGIDVDVQDSAQLTKTIEAEVKKWAGWVKTAGISPE